MYRRLLDDFLRGTRAPDLTIAAPFSSGSLADMLDQYFGGVHPLADADELALCEICHAYWRCEHRLPESEEAQLQYVAPDSDTYIEAHGDDREANAVYRHADDPRAISDAEFARSGAGIAHPALIVRLGSDAAIADDIAIAVTDFQNYLVASMVDAQDLAARMVDALRDFGLAAAAGLQIDALLSQPMLASFRRAWGGIEDMARARGAARAAFLAWLLARTRESSRRVPEPVDRAPAARTGRIHRARAPPRGRVEEIRGTGAGRSARAALRRPERSREIGRAHV